MRAETDENKRSGALSVQIPMKIYGDDAYPVWHRHALPLDAPRARYPGFKPGSERLKTGTIRRAGAKPLSCDIMLDRDVAVALRDGTTLYCDILRPVDAGNYPAILSWSPYGKQVGGDLVDDVPHRAAIPMGALSEIMKFEGVDPDVWVGHGYVVIHPDTRGSYKSQGHIPYWGRQLAEDGYDVIEWAATQAWSNGKIGMAGNSWLAISQWFIAAERPPHLAAIAPWEGKSDVMREFALRGGIPMLAFNELMLQNLAGENLVEDLAKMAVTEPYETPYWKDKVAQVEKIDVPAYIAASYDNFLHTQGTFEAFRKIGSSEKWLRVHNTHEWPDLYDNTAELKSFFDHYLKGEDNDWARTPSIRISVLDPGREDEIGREVEAWPPSGYDHSTLYLSASGDLSADPAEQSSVRYTAEGGSPAAFRATIDHDAELVGYMMLKLWVEADGSDDIDLTIAVEKLDPHGSQILRSNGRGTMVPLQFTGAVRASRRKLDPARSTRAEPYLLLQDEEPLKLGEIVPLEINIWPAGLRIHAGEMLQVTVTPYTPPDVTAFQMPFGSARITIPVDTFTYTSGEQVEMQTLGGPAEASPPWVAEQGLVEDLRNTGTYAIHVGGRYDSHILVPMKRI